MSKRSQWRLRVYMVNIEAHCEMAHWLILFYLGPRPKRFRSPWSDRKLLRGIKLGHAVGAGGVVCIHHKQPKTCSTHLRKLLFQGTASGKLLDQIFYLVWEITLNWFNSIFPWFTFFFLIFCSYSVCYIKCPIGDNANAPRIKKNLVKNENDLGSFCSFAPLFLAWVAWYANSSQCFCQQADNLVRNN